MNKKGCLSLFLYFAAVVTCIILMSIDFESYDTRMTVGGIGALGGIILLCFGAYKIFKITKDDEKKAKENAELRKNYISKSKYTGNGLILYLNERNPIVRTGFAIKKSTDDTITKVPEKLHVGAVTVGGVTTGGTYKTGGYNEVSSKHNGLFELQYEGRNVSRIELSYSLLEEAQKSSISKYLCDVEGILGNASYSDRQIYSTLYNLDERYIMVVDYVPSTMNQYHELKSGINRKYGYPTYEKCLEILNWISGED